MKIVLNDVASAANVSVMNSNFQKIEDALNDQVLYRDNPIGEPNTMNDNLDMNGNRIYNLPKPASPTEPVRLQDLDGINLDLTARDIKFDPTSDISATNVQDAIEETYTELTLRINGVTALNPKNFGAVGDGVTDDHAAFLAWAAEVKDTGKNWFIPEGTYLLNGTGAIELVRGGVCEGEIHIPKSNQTVRFDFVRDNKAGTVLSTTGWNPLTRGMVTANALNAFNKNLFLSSTEIATERFNPPSNTPYLKQEFIRCRTQLGSFSTALVNTYTSFANLTVTSHDPSIPITVTGLRIIRTGTGSPAIRGSIVIWRDNVTMNSSGVINQDTTQPLAFLIEVGYCADVVLNQCYASGCRYGGLGYGIVSTATIGVTYNDCNISDAREAHSGAYNVDLTINGGTWSDTVDDHWGNRMIVKNAEIRAVDGGCAVQYAGNDLTVSDCKIFGGRSVVGIRTDTPSLGGKVIMNNITIASFGISSEWYGFGFTSSPGTGSMSPLVFTVKPTMPDHVTIRDLNVTCNAASVYVAFLGMCETAHKSWGVVEVTGTTTLNVTGTVIGIMAYKNATYQEDRAATIIWDSPVDLGLGTVLYAIPFDSSNTRAFNMRVSNMLGGSLRFSPYSCQTLIANDCAIRDVENDNIAHSFTNQRYTFNNCNFTGGLINVSFRRMSINNSVFSGTLTAFPYDGVTETNYVTLIGNVRSIAQPNLPGDIFNNVVSPYDTVTPVEATAANLLAIGNAINTTNKHKGKLVWDTTNNRMLRATGRAANATWIVVDGSVIVTPV